MAMRVGAAVAGVHAADADHHNRDNQHFLFSEINNLRTPQHVDQEDLDAKERAKYNDTCFGAIVKHKAFEITTMIVISLNAVAIGYDADYDARWGKPGNLYDGPIGFIIIEWIFAIYFSLEVIIRFFAYRSKIDCFFDPWFVFDSLLVTMMVVETWVLPFLGSGGPLGQLSILRLLRLLRITRMARLMRAVPEMMVIIRGMFAATRTVCCTGSLLVLVLYVFSILFATEYHQGNLSDGSSDITDAEALFGSMGKCMFTLFIMGTVLDDYTQATDAIRSSENYWMLVAFIVFTLISSFMMLNMLIGILVEIIGATSEGEQTKQQETYVREAIATIFNRLDKDSNKEITHAEFMDMKHNQQVMEALASMDIASTHFDLYAELFFRPKEEGGAPPSLSYEKLVTMIFRLRPGSSISQLDFALFQETITDIYERIRERVGEVERLCVNIARAILGDDDEGIRSINSGGIDMSNSYLAVPNPPRKKANQSKSGATLENGESKDSAPRSISKYSARSALSANDRQRLSKLSEADLIDELQRRIGVADIEKTGVPCSMLDEELQARLCNGHETRAGSVKLDPEEHAEERSSKQQVAMRLLAVQKPESAVRLAAEEANMVAKRKEEAAKKAAEEAEIAQRKVETTRKEAEEARRAAADWENGHEAPSSHLNLEFDRDEEETLARRGDQVHQDVPGVMHDDGVRYF